MFIEYCPHCQTEQGLDDALGLLSHICECGEKLLPCKLCTDMHNTYAEAFDISIEVPCHKCPFDYHEYTNKETK